jgi:hypothetical protein
MSLGFLLPAALAALAALAIPLLLHLQRRTQRPLTISFAAMRWLQQPKRPRRHFQLREPWLLLVRCLLVAAVVLALAQPMLGGMAPRSAWHVVWPGVDADAIEWPDQAAQVERRWLATGFPPLSAAMPVSSDTPASLLRELDVLLPESTPLTIHVPAQVDGLDGARLVLGREVVWNIVAGGLGGAAVLPACLEQAGGSEELATKVPPTDSASIASSPMDPASADPAVRDSGDCVAIGAPDSTPHGAVVPTPRALRIAVAGAPDGHRGMRFLQAAHAAWSADAASSADASEHEAAELPEQASNTAPPDTLDALLWLSPEPLTPTVRDWLAAGGRVLAIGAVIDDDSGVTLWQGRAGAQLRGARIGRGELRMLDCPLDPRCLPELLDADFPARLREWLSAPAPMPARAEAAHIAPDRMERRAPAPMQPLASWLIMLAGLLFVLERWMANGRRPP